MKYTALFVVAAALLFAAAKGDDDEYYEFIHHKHPCVWSVEMDAKSPLRHNIYKLSVNGWYIRFTVTNDNGIVVQETVIRPDITETRYNLTYGTICSFDRFECDCNPDVLIEVYKEDPLAILSDSAFSLFEDKRMVLNFIDVGRNFTNKTTGRINEDDDDEEKYTVYYDTIPFTSYGKDDFALYVDKDNYVAGIVVDNDKPGERVEVRFTYNTEAYLDEFTFNEEEVEGCPEKEIFKAPKEKNICGASSLQVVLGLVIASLVAALL